MIPVFVAVLSESSSLPTPVRLDKTRDSCSGELFILVSHRKAAQTEFAKQQGRPRAVSRKLAKDFRTVQPQDTRIAFLRVLKHWQSMDGGMGSDIGDP